MKIIEIMKIIDKKEMQKKKKKKKDRNKAIKKEWELNGFVMHLS